jgi:hypothetical protein
MPLSANSDLIYLSITFEKKGSLLSRSERNNYDLLDKLKISRKSDKKRKSPRPMTFKVN